MKNSPIPEINELAENCISWEYDPLNPLYISSMVENKVMSGRTHATLNDNQGQAMYKYMEEKYDTYWYQSSDTMLSENPYENWISKKKWPLNEELNMHFLRYQQVPN